MSELEKIIEILKKSKSSGIYKIINPKGSIYIGSSLDIGKRFVYYLKKYNKLQIKLFNSFNKYGVENHIFEIVELIKNDDKNVLNNLLNERELYWGQFYKSLDKNNLNLKIGNRNAIVSEETKKRMSLSGKGIKRTQEFKDNVSKFHKGRTSPTKGLRFSEETKIKISNGVKNSYTPEKYKSKYNKPINQFTKDGIFIKCWNSSWDAMISTKISHINDCCNGKRNTAGGYIWKYKN